MDNTIVNKPETADYLQHLRTEETFVRLREIFVKRWGVFLCISGIAVVIQFLLSLAIVPLLMALGVEGEHSSQEDMDDYYNNMGDDGMNNNNNNGRWLQDATYTYDGGNGALSILVLVINYVLYYIVVAISDGALIRAVAEMYVSRIPSPMAVTQRALRRIVPLVGTPLLVSIALFIPFFGLTYLMLMIPSFSLAILVTIVFLFVAWFVSIVTYHTYPAIIVEVPPRGVIGSLKRSWELSAGHREYILIVTFLFAVFKLIGQWVLTTILWFLGNYYLSTIVNLAYLTFTAALGSILQAIVYFSVRTAKEGLTVDILAQELQMDMDTPYESMGNTTEMVNSSNPADPEVPKEAPTSVESSKETPLV